MLLGGKLSRSRVKNAALLTDSTVPGKSTSKISPELLRNQLDYDPQTGICYWKVSRPSVRCGKVAGRLMNNGHWSVRLFQKDYLRSHIAFCIMTGNWPTLEMDHINHIPSDDRWENIRQVTSGQNKFNKIAVGRNLPRGVSKNGKGFRARWGNKGFSLNFKTIEEAVEFRKMKLEELNLIQYLPKG